MTEVAVITSTSAGIGEATVERLIERSYTTYPSARRLDRMASFEKPGAILLPLDLTDDRPMLISLPDDGLDARKPSVGASPHLETPLSAWWRSGVRRRVANPNGLRLRKTVVVAKKHCVS